MAQFPGFAPMGSGNGNADIGMTDADGHVVNPVIEPPTPSITRTADHFGKSLRISPPKLSIPNPSRNYFAISAAVDPTFSTPPLPADDDMVTSSSGPSAPTGPPQVLPMTPVFYPDQVKPLVVGPPTAAPSVVPPAPLPMAPPVAPPPPAPGAASNYESGGRSATSADTPIPNPPARNKVPLERGYSQMVWLRLMQTEPDLAGLKGESPRRILTMDEIKKHKTEDEAWTVLRNRVYNITPYLKFHPGGPDMLMKAAGRDGTSLFNKYHAWVNAEFLMEKCLVGHLEVQGQADK